MRPREVQTLRKVTQELVKSQDKSQSNLAPHSPPARLTTPQTANMVSPTKISVFFFFKIDFDVLRLRETSNFNQFFKIANFIHPGNSHTNRRAD